MTRSVFLVILSFMSSGAAAQHLPDMGVDKVRLSDSAKSIIAEIHPADDLPKAKPELSYYWYSANAIHMTRGGYSGKLLNGTYTEYYQNKNLKRQGTYQAGLSSGTWREWTPEGELISIYSWKAGKLSGPFWQYDGNGNLLEKGNYSNGLLQGSFRHYAGRDSVTVLFYKNGQIVKRGSAFYKKFNFFKRNRPDSSAVSKPSVP